MSQPELLLKRKHKPLSLSTKKQKSKETPPLNPQTNALPETINENLPESSTFKVVPKPPVTIAPANVCLSSLQPNRLEVPPTKTRHDYDDWNRLPAEVEEHLTKALDVEALLRSMFLSCPKSQPFTGKTFFAHEKCPEHSRLSVQRDEDKARFDKGSIMEHNTSTEARPYSATTLHPSINPSLSASPKHVFKTASKDPPLLPKPEAILSKSHQQGPKTFHRQSHKQDDSRSTVLGLGSERSEHSFKLGKNTDRVVKSVDPQKPLQPHNSRRNGDTNETKAPQGLLDKSFHPQIPQRTLPLPAHSSPGPSVPFKAPPPESPSPSSNKAQVDDKLGTCPLCGMMFPPEMTNPQINGHVDECLNKAYFDDGGSVDV